MRLSTKYANLLIENGRSTNEQARKDLMEERADAGMKKSRLHSNNIESINARPENIGKVHPYFNKEELYELIATIRKKLKQDITDDKREFLEENLASYNQYYNIGETEYQNPNAHTLSFGWFGNSMR